MCQKKKELSPKQISIIYASEADVLNIALFGMTAKQWRDRDGAYLIPTKDDKIGVVKTSKGYFHPIQTYYVGKLLEQVCVPVEDDHEFVWVDYNELVDNMYLEMQSWALEQCMNFVKG